MKRVAISVSNDLVTDQRVQRSISVLEEQGYSVNFIGRQVPESYDFNPDYQYHRFKLWFHKGFLFYAQLNVWLFFYLLFQKPYSLYWSNDLDTLLPNFLVSKIYGRPLIYDSHEYFCGVPEIQNRPLVKAVWQRLEAWIFPKLKWLITVNDSIAALYQADYGIRPRVVRNVGNSFFPKRLKSRKELGLSEDHFLVINQGAGINVDRGMEEFLEALAECELKIQLLIVGKGDVVPALKKRAQDADLENKVIFIDPLPYAEMLQYTAQADLGISLDKGSNVNYRFSLPNKVFDYIKAGIPILCSEVIEVKSIVEDYKIGRVTKVEPKAIRANLEKMHEEGSKPYKAALAKAKTELNWDQEKQGIVNLLTQINS